MPHFTAIEKGTPLSIRLCPVGSEYRFSGMNKKPGKMLYNRIKEVLSYAYGIGIPYNDWYYGNNDEFECGRNTWYYRDGDYSTEIFLVNSEQLQYILLSVPNVTLRGKT